MSTDDKDEIVDPYSDEEPEEIGARVWPWIVALILIILLAYWRLFL